MAFLLVYPLALKRRAIGTVPSGDMEIRPCGTLR